MGCIVDSMTESEPDVPSERASYDALGEQGQHHEMGKVFGRSVSDVGELCFALRSVLAEKLLCVQIPWHTRCYGWRVKFAYY